MTPKTSRKYFIDWLRILLIFSVFLFHIGMYFNPWSWHVKNDIIVTWLNDLMWFLHLWRMPLLFLVSGVGTYYALGFRTTKQYLGERFRRIYIPFAVGIFTLVPVQVYIEKITQYPSLGNYYLHMFDGIYPEGNFSWHHLWFLVYLFIMALLISPFLNYLRSEKFLKIRDQIVQYASKPLGLNLFLLILIASQAILRQYFPDQTNALFNDWAYFGYYFLFFLSGFALMTSKKMIEAIKEQRRWYLIQTVICTVFMFSISNLFENQLLMDWLYGIIGIVVGWSCGITAIGYARRYLNRNNKWRKTLNEGIYPFYLLHQPIIIVLGYYIQSWQLPVIVKMLVLTTLSLAATIGIYWFIVRRFNPLRFIFGLKPLRKKEPLVLQKAE